MKLFNPITCMIHKNFEPLNEMAMGDSRLIVPKTNMFEAAHKRMYRMQKESYNLTLH